jgi:hypothetical protein
MANILPAKKGFAQKKSSNVVDMRETPRGVRRDVRCRFDSFVSSLVDCSDCRNGVLRHGLPFQCCFKNDLCAALSAKKSVLPKQSIVSERFPIEFVFDL